MPKGQNQKAKLLHLARILNSQTDQEHPMSIARMMDLLQAQGVDVKDRKSLYDDLETLRTFGMDIEMQREGRSVGYYVASRLFELPELKLLVDAVQSSRFITRKKTDQLIRKVESLASSHQGRQLQRQVFVTRRIKAMNESIYYTVDALHEAIDEGKQIRFHYFEYTVSKTRRFRRDGAWYELSPFALSWDDENYYMVAYDSESGRMKHFRVDKMLKIEMSKEKRDGKECFQKTDPAVYSKNMFGMFSGESEMLSIQIPEYMLGVFVDRFGKDISVRKSGEKSFTVHIQAIISEQFFGWLTGLGKDVIIVSPQKTMKEYQAYLEGILKKYQ